MRGQIKHQRWVYIFCDRVSDARFYLARDVLRLTACTTEGTHSKSLSARRPGALSVDSSGRVPGKIGQEWTDRAPAARGRGVSVEILGGCCGGRREPLRMHFSAHSDICIYLSTYLSISLPIHTHTAHAHAYPNTWKRACKWPGLCGRPQPFAAAMHLSYTRMCLTAPYRMRYGSELRVGRAARSCLGQRRAPR